jgi:hypothetical protein
MCAKDDQAHGDETDDGDEPSRQPVVGQRHDRTKADPDAGRG